MFSIIRKLGFLVGLTLCVIVNGYSQVVISTRSGTWTDPSVWDGGLVPTLVNATEIVINHEITIPNGSMISMRNVIVNGTLTIETGAIVDLIPDGLTEKFDLQVFGVLTLQDGATLNGTATANTSFESGARYIHLQGPLGFIPYATWNSNATFEIAGFRSQGYINIAHSDSWKQNFGHVVYNCTQQTTAFVDLNGYLRNIRGNFIVQSTNNQALRLSTTQNPVISIGGDFLIEGPSKVWFSTNPTNAFINIQNDFRYRSTSAGISYMTTKGVVTVTVMGEMEMNSPGRLHMASTSQDSTGTRLATFSLHSHLTITAGSIVGPPAPGKGKINFAGTTTQLVTTPSSVNVFQGTLDYLVDVGSTVNTQQSVLSNSAGTLWVKGKLQLGSTDPGGAIQLTNRGNIQVQGERIFEPGSIVEYNGLAEQWIGTGHPSSPDLHLICNNSAGTTLLKDLVVNDMTILAKFDTQLFPLTVFGNISIAPEIDCVIHQINLAGSRQQQISASSAVIQNLLINKSAETVNLVNSLLISEVLVIASTNTTLHSNGYLVLLSTTDDGPGTASVGPLPSGSFIEGDVTVQRHMDGEGRIYRYISSPVQNSSVASLKDDFPITGRFQDPSTGSGIRPSSPSFYYYDESRGGLQEGWRPYPTSGLASANPLGVGKGYAAFIQKGNESITWDVTGPLNQGTIELPVDFTPNDQPSNGWNLVGNPYACAIQWDEEGDGKWTMENISSVIAIRDNGSAGGGTYRYWDIDDNYSEIPGGQIASGQSFWVRATAMSPKLTIREGVKVMGGAAFLRKETAPIPSFALELSRDSLHDVAFFKIRPNAKPGIDDWDGVKLDNDNFDVSFISTDKKSLAIHATNRFPCDTVIQVGMKDLVPGTYKLGLTTKHDFSRYQYTLLDRFSQTEISLSPGETTSLMVTSDPASYAFDRIALRIAERKPDSGIELLGPSSTCIDRVVTLVAKDAEIGIRYSLWDNGSWISSIKSMEAGEVKFVFPADSLSPGEHSLHLQAHSSCHIVPVDADHLLTVYTIPKVWADSNAVCAGHSMLLKASSDQGNVTFHWFSDEQSNDTLATGYIFETSPLFKPQVYYVAATTLSGCSSKRYPVKVFAKTFEGAKISVLGDSILASNFEKGNTWYFNDDKIEGVTGPYLTLDLPGMYGLRVDTLGCLSEDNFEFIMMDKEEEAEEPSFYPNPAQEMLLIRDDKNVVKSMEIFDLLGKRAILWRGSQKNHPGVYAIDVRALPDGKYIGIVTTSSGKHIVRFGKLSR